MRSTSREVKQRFEGADTISFNPTQEISTYYLRGIMKEYNTTRQWSGTFFKLAEAFCLPEVRETYLVTKNN